MAKIPIDIKSGEIKKETPLIVGIDLGTTNSLVSYMKDDKPVVVSDRNNKNTLIPSVVGFDASGNIIVGDNAKQRLVLAHLI